MSIEHTADAAGAYDPAAPVYDAGGITVYAGDVVEVLARLPDNSVDAVVTDPPYGLEFMGQDWDRPWAVGSSETGYTDGAQRLPRPAHGDNRNPTCASCGGRARGAKRCACETPQWKPTGGRRGRPDVRQPGDPTFHVPEGTQWGRIGVRHGLAASYGGDTASAMRLFQGWCERWAAECHRVLKPGGHLLAFGGTRTYHRLACAVEDAGFEVRDSIAWHYLNGFPKNLDVSKAIDKAAGARREVTGRVDVGPDMRGDNYGRGDGERMLADVTGEPVTSDAKRWHGWGTALKPAHEPIVVARKPLAGTVVATVLAHGTGALNIDACRVPTDDKLGGGAETRTTAEQKGNAGWTRPWMDDEDAQAEHAKRVRANVAHAEQAGRWPPNVLLTHHPDCRPAGATTSVPSNSHYPAARGKGGLSTSGHAGKDGLVERRPGAETVELWACAPGCQVAALDTQSGQQRDGVASGRSRGFSRDGYVGGTGSDYNGEPQGYGGEGGASRCFPRFTAEGRWPPNVLLDQDQADQLDAQSGQQTSSVRTPTGRDDRGVPNTDANMVMRRADSEARGVADAGGASRCFPRFPTDALDELPARLRYTPKAGADERVRVGGVAHPTVKPLDLMRWLVRLVTRPGGVVLEPFAGSGTTVEACILEGLDCIAVERDPTYLPLIRQRIDRRRDPVAAVNATRADDGPLDLFGLLDQDPP